MTARLLASHDHDKTSKSERLKRCQQHKRKSVTSRDLRRFGGRARAAGRFCCHDSNAHFECGRRNLSHFCHIKPAVSKVDLRLCGHTAVCEPEVSAR